MRLSSFESAALGKSPAAQNSIAPEITGPSQTLAKIFTYQSYFDSTLLENAILEQLPNNPIVPSTAQAVQISGYGIGLHPSSQTPVALNFDVGNQPSSSGAVVLKPGEVYRPFGRPDAKRSGSFSGFTWGLPYGWLGGGFARLAVLLSPDASVNWGTTNEVIFHRVRVPIWQQSQIVADFNARKNWPMRFPWTQAISGTDQIEQKGKPTLAIVEPTRTLAVLRGLDALANPAMMRMIYQGTNDVGLDSSGAVVLTTPIFEDITWPTWAALGVGGALFAPDPALMLTGMSARLAADDGGLALIDATGSAVAAGELEDCFVDFVRYGRL